MNRNRPVLQVTFIAIAFAVCTMHAQEAKRPAADFAARALLRFDTLPVMNAVPHVPTSLAGRTVLAKGRFGQALDAIKSEGMALTIPVPAQPEDELTLECWVKLMGDGKDRLQRIVGRNSNYGFYTNAKGGSLTWFVMADDWKSCRGRLPLGEWCHIAGTFDGQTMRLYLNGKMVGECANPGSVERRSTSYFVGAEAGSGKNAFNGLIDEVRLSSIVRTTFMTGIPLEEPKPTTTFRLADLGTDAFAAKMTVLSAQTAPKIDGDLGDAAWTRLPAAEFVTTKKATRPLSPTSIRVTRDAECLYLAYRCQEKGQETQRPGPAGQGNMAVFKHDGVEVLLQPGGSGTPYFQIAMNPAGGLVALKYAKAGTRAPWTPKGIRVSGVVHADYWTVEAAIPFADLQVEAPGTGGMWRANFCRNELPSRELSAWSYTGGGFHVLKRFGTLTFAEGGEPQGGQIANGRCELRGTVVDADGKPMSNVPVKTMVGLVRTDLLGTFRLQRLPQTDIALEINTPVCHPVQGWVSLRKARETLAPIRLTRIDPYLPAFTTAPGTGPVTWLRSSIDEPPDMTMAPAADQLASQLELLATPGEYESRAVAFFARADIVKPSAVVLDMKTEGGATIAASALRVRWTQRLLKRVHYTRPPEDAVWNWRFLWDEAPKSVQKGHVRQLVLTVKIPTDARPGLYQGTLQLSMQGKSLASLPVRLRIAPFTLVKPAKIVGAYYGIRGLSDTQIARELDDIREHGGSVLIWSPSVRYIKDEEGGITPGFSSIRHAVELQKKAGLGPPYLVGTRPLALARALGLKVEMTPEFGKILLADESFVKMYKDTVRKLDALEKEMGAGEFVYTWMDEVFGRGRYEVWEAAARLTREASDHRIYITFHNRNQEMVDRIAPWVDVRCYHGHTLDWWQQEGHSWDELKEELEKDGDTAWCYYNIREIAVTSEWVRLCNGYWLWRSPLQGHMPWKYYSYGNNPFDDLDSDRHDFAYAAPHPTRPQMVSTLEWECFREGYDDLRYIATLEAAIAAAEKDGRNPEELRKARALLRSWWGGQTRVPALAETLTGQDYARRRIQLAAHIEALATPR